MITRTLPARKGQQSPPIIWKTRRPESCERGGGSNQTDAAIGNNPTEEKVNVLPLHISWQLNARGRSGRLLFCTLTGNGTGMAQGGSLTRTLTHPKLELAKMAVLGWDGMERSSDVSRTETIPKFVLLSRLPAHERITAGQQF